MKLPQPGSNRSYAPEQLIEPMIVSIGCAAARFDQGSATRVQSSSYRWVFDKLHLKSITLDVDCSVITRWGSQMQGAAKGYNPKNHGRVSHHPLLAFVVAFVADWRLVANFWLRPGNTHSLNNALGGFLEETLSNHRHDWGRSVQGR